MDAKISAYKAKSFIAERDISSIAYEVKRTRAVWDDALSIPGTNRRGGWRCPPGTRYGGQITDRFGRNCGWGVSRRIANQISDIGERLEEIGDRRQRRREQRAMRRQGRGAGAVERAAGRVARALESTDVTPEAPRPRRERQGAARRRPNFRPSEQRRIDREILQPGAPRTNERRRTASVDVVEKPRPEAPVAKPAKKAAAKKAAAKKAPAKKAAAKKAAAKKAPAKKRVATKKPVKKAAAPRIVPGNSDNAARSEEVRRAAERINVRDFAPADLQIDAGIAKAADNIDQIVPDNRDGAKAVANAYSRSLRKTEKALRAQPDDAIVALDNGDEMKVSELRKHLVNAADAWDRVAERAARLNPTQRNQSQPDWERLGQIQIGDGINWNELNDVFGPIYGNERWADIEERKQKDDIVKENIQRRIQLLKDDNAELEDIKTERDRYQSNARRWRNALEEAVLQFENEPDANARKRLAKSIYDFNENLRAAHAYHEAFRKYAQELENGRPAEKNPYEDSFIRTGWKKDGDKWVKGRWQARVNENGNLEAKNPATGESYEQSRNDRLTPSERFADFERVLREADPDGMASPQPGTVKPEPLADNVAAVAEKRVKDAIKKRKNLLADYLDKRYGEGNAPWKEMNNKKLTSLLDIAANRAASPEDRAEAKRQIEEWAKAMYSHDEIIGSNGKKYQIVATASLVGRSIGVSAVIYHIDENGVRTQIGTSTRSLTPDRKNIYNGTMFIDVAAHKNAGIQTIYNQHAWMYGVAAGFETVGVSAVRDGPYVWGRIGFGDSASLRAGMPNMALALAKFRRGEASIIDNEEDANIIEYLLQKERTNPGSVRHMDFIYALGNRATNKRDRKSRETKIKNWFQTNMPFNRGELNLAQNDIVADPRDER